MKFAFGTLVPFFFIGCASTGTGDLSSLKNRAEQYWKLIQNKDTLSSYGYEEVSIAKKTPIAEYVKVKGRLSFKSIEVGDARVDEKGDGWVSVKSRSVLPELGIKEPIEMNVQDRWVFVNGQWFHAFKQGADAGNQNESKKKSE